MQKGFTPIIILVGILVLASVGGVYYFFKVKTPEQKACTQEAKICPDGTFVGRVGPNCEFAPCPKSSPSPTPDETASWKTYQGENYSFKYPENWVFTIDVKTKDPKISLIDFVNDVMKQIPYGAFSQKEILVVGKSTLIQEASIHPAGRQMAAYILEDNSTILVIYARNIKYSDPATSLPNNITQEFAEILSTFKFLE